MNAEEMFNQLGYEFEKEYTSDGVNDTYRYNKCSRPSDSVIFYLDGKQIIINQTFNTIHLNELQAIVQQCKELGWLEEQKQETNFEHFKDEISNLDFNFAVVNGKVVSCEDSPCNECYFKRNACGCNKIKIEWLYEQYKEKYNLTQFEYDLLQSFLCKCRFKNMDALTRMKEKGYFEGIDENAKIEDILAKCEVV